MEPQCLNIIFIRVCVCNTCGFHIRIDFSIANVRDKLQTIMYLFIIY
ncbi:MAG: hypothetical protein BWZ11_01263 [Bacteroidetes bacterium ADurb.BinA395]|nr:MAG: hypothetical protein BWZ11_01263 [Bacteroidetes bacterium ADurb.BinA395]